MARFVRPSKFRHVFGTANKREQCYDGLNISSDSNDLHLVKVNPQFLSVHWGASGGGSFLVLPLGRVGKLSWSPTDTPLFNGHAATVLDTDFNPFNDYVVASAGADAKVMVWVIPEGGLSESCTTPAAVLSGHDRKVVSVLFHPSADNVLASASCDFSARVWDVEKAMCRSVLDGHTDAIIDQAWNYAGNLLATTCRDKMLRIFDVRTGKVVQECKAHDGVKGARLTWMGNTDRLLTTGFSRMSDRQFSMWDMSSGLSTALKTENLDTSSGVLIPHYDADTRMLYLAGKGDGNIRYYEMVDDAPYSHYLSEYRSADPQRGIAFMPKRAVNVSENEVARAYKVFNNCVEPISFQVPRRHDSFQADIFPNTSGAIPAITADDFFVEGKTAAPLLVDLSQGFVAQPKRDFSASAGSSSFGTLLNKSAGLGSMATSLGNMSIVNGSSSDGIDYREAYMKLKNEYEALKTELAQKTMQLNQIQASLSSSVLPGASAAEHSVATSCAAQCTVGNAN